MSSASSSSDKIETERVLNLRRDSGFRDGEQRGVPGYISPWTVVGHESSPMQSSVGGGIYGEFADYAFPFSPWPLGEVNPYENRIIVLFSPLKEAFVSRAFIPGVISFPIYLVIPLLYVLSYASCNRASCHSLKHFEVNLQFRFADGVFVFLLHA